MHRRIGSRTSILAGRVRKRSAMSRKLVAFSSDLPRSQSQHGSRHLLDQLTYFARIAQLRVMCLILSARLASSTGAYVSMRTGYVITVTAKELIAVMYSIHRQPRGLCTMKAPTWKWLANEFRLVERGGGYPTVGPRMGPIARKVAAQGIANPRCLGVQMSASMPLRIAEGAAPKTPFHCSQSDFVRNGRM
jgi:hypothetical protein